MTGKRPKSRILRAARAQLAEHFPQAFPLDDAAIRPLVITARDDLSAWIATQPDPAALKPLIAALQQHCSRRTYPQILAAGDPSDGWSPTPSAAFMQPGHRITFKSISSNE